MCLKNFTNKFDGSVMWKIGNGITCSWKRDFWNIRNESKIFPMAYRWNGFVCSHLAMFRRKLMLLYFFIRRPMTVVKTKRMLVLLSIYLQSATGPIISEERYRCFVNKERNGGRRLCNKNRVKSKSANNITKNIVVPRGTWAEKRVFYTVLQWENRRFGWSPGLWKTRDPRMGRQR